VPEIAIEPEFVIRQSTGPAPVRHLTRVGAGSSNLQEGFPGKISSWAAGYSHFPVPSTIVT